MEKARGPGRVVFAGRKLTVRVDPVDTSGGPGTREVVVRGPAVAVVAQAVSGLIVIRQFRWALQRQLWELPAGEIDPGESPAQAALRELAEETGYRAGRLIWVDRFYPSPGYSTEWLDLFYATDLAATPRSPDPDEEIEVEVWARDEVERRLAHHDVINGIALLGLNWWLRTQAAAAP
ncbi:MAG: NUDIX hydrolase [Thermaerobacter sp.]|nr:NUDIX hydrolase [Thermaerobacter sp.]